MSPAVAELLESALKLSNNEQLMLLTALLSALDQRRQQPFDTAWLAEADRRSNEFDAGTVVARPWREVKERSKHHRE